MLAQESLDQIRELLSSSCARAGNPKDMAAFLRHESEGRLHCEAMVYFSPRCASVAKALKAQPCERPSPDDLSLLAGSEDSRLKLFPG